MTAGGVVWQTGGGAGFELGVLAFDGHQEIRVVVLLGLTQDLSAGVQDIQHDQLARSSPAKPPTVRQSRPHTGTFRQPGCRS